MRGGVGETRHLPLLGEQVPDRVEHEVDEPEAPLDARRDHAADRHVDPIVSVLRTKPVG